MSESPTPSQKDIQPEETVQDPTARTVPVQVNGGILLVGWAIKQDTVLVEASGLGSARVSISGRDVTPIASHETTQGVDSRLPLTALELPAGTLEVSGEHYPPHLGPAVLSPDAIPDVEGPGDRIAFWCRMFPRMRGC